MYNIKGLIKIYMHQYYHSFGVFAPSIMQCNLMMQNIYSKEIANTSLQIPHNTTLGHLLKNVAIVVRNMIDGRGMK